MLGDINIDTVWPVNELPSPGRDAYADSVATGLGGAVLNTAIMLDQLGQPTAMLSCIGQDIWAAQVMKMLKRTNINLDYIRTQPDYATGLVFLAVTPDGERTMFSFRGANTHLEAADIQQAAFERAAVLHISGYSLLEAPQRDAVWRAVELARQHQVAVSLDTGLEPALLIPREIIRLINELTICVTGPKETEELFNISAPEKAAEHLLDLGVKLAAIKMGEKGCYLMSEREAFFCPAFPVRVVDTTGAGDCFSAGLLYGWTHGLSLPAAAVLAGALGAIATTVYGAGLALPGKQTVLEILQSARKLPLFEKNRGLDEVIAFLDSDS